MTAWAAAAEDALVARLEDLRCGSNADAMRSYMRDQFSFIGAKSKDVQVALRVAKREADAIHGPATADDLVAFAAAMWVLPEREHQYAGAKALDAASRRKDLGGLAPRHLDAVRDLIVARSWWDTVDILAPNVVGALARAHPDEIVPVLDRWLVDDRWLVRSAMLHQLKSKGATDPDRLSRYGLIAAGHEDFFVRKAIGWALRQYSYIDPDWVEAFVVDHADQLSGLSRREAMKAIARRRSAAS